jgi:hypothetical protein
MANEFVRISSAIRTTIPAAASIWNPSCGWEIQEKIWMGSALYSLRGPSGAKVM